MFSRGNSTVFFHESSRQFGPVMSGSGISVLSIDGTSNPIHHAGAFNAPVSVMDTGNEYEFI